MLLLLKYLNGDMICYMRDLYFIYLQIKERKIGEDIILPLMRGNYQINKNKYYGYCFGRGNFHYGNLQSISVNMKWDCKYLFISQHNKISAFYIPFYK